MGSTEKEKEKSEDEKELDIPDSHKCGYGPCKPDCMQRSCNTPVMLLFVACLFVFIQTYITSGIVSVNMSTLERRYELSSGEVAWIPSSYDIVGGVFAIIFGYLGIFVHNGVLLTIAAYFLAVGSFVMTLPHWLGGTYEAGQETVKLCDIHGNGTVCDEGESSYLGFFIVAQALHGVGGSALWVLIFPYIDANIRREKTSMYIGIAYMAAGLGAAAGYMFGGLLLSVYVDVGRVSMDEVAVELGDPRWVGAWWIGYLIASFICIVTGIMMCAFPRELPSGLYYKSERVCEAYKGIGVSKTESKNFGKSLKDIGYSLKVILVNPIWYVNTIVSIVISGIVVAFAVFLPKLMETQFSLSAGAAAAVAGLTVAIGGFFGLLIGGWIPRKFNLSARGLMVQSLVAALFGVVTAFIYLVHCKSPAIAGVSVPYFASDSSIELEEPNVYHQCNTKCNCTTAAYDPICGSYDDVQYFSPCLAACMRSVEIDNDEEYYECDCVNATQAPPGEGVIHATKGVCGADCSSDMTLFICLFIVQLVATFMGMPAGLTLGLRAVPDKERVFAFGITSLLTRYLGNVPAPLILGAIFDSSCLMWQESCGETGNCWVYDSSGLGWGFTWCVFTVSSICVVCYIVAIVVYKPPPPEVVETVYVTPEPKMPPGDQEALEKRAADSARGSIISLHSADGGANGGAITKTPVGQSEEARECKELGKTVVTETDSTEQTKL